MSLHSNRICLRVLTFLLFLLMAGGGAAAEPVTITSQTPYIDLAGNAEYLEDPTGKLTVEEVAAAADRFRPTKAGENINFTYSTSAFWLRLSVTGATSAPSNWILEISYPSLDWVDWYYPSDSGFQRMKSGDRNPFFLRDRPHRNIVFPVRVESGKAATYYLRIASEGTLAVPGRLWPNQSFQRESERSYLVLGIYFGTMAALLLYNLMLYLALRDRVLLQYVGYVAGFILGIASMNGLGVELLWPDSIWWANSSLVFGLGCAIFCAVMFARTFTNCAALSRRVDFALKASLLLAAATVLASLALPYRFATLLLSITALVFPPAAYYAGWLAWRCKVPGARYFLVAWALMLLTIATLAMRNFGWLPSTFLTNNGMQIGSMVEALLLSFSLADRYNRLAAERNAAQAEAINARESMVDTLRRSEQLLEQRVVERTRELEAANIELKQREKQLADMAHHDTLTGLSNRALLTDHLIRALARTERSGNPSGLALLEIDLDGFKEINDRYGHAAGDELLVEISNRLRSSVRASDLVARLGGDEFVVVLDAPGKEDELRRIAENMVGLVSTPIRLGDYGLVTVGASIGIAILEDKDTVATLMRRADRAMYAAKARGRGRYELA